MSQVLGINYGGSSTKYKASVTAVLLTAAFILINIPR